MFGEVDRVLDLHGSAREDVTELHSSFCQHLSDKQSSVAVLRIRLAADDCDSVTVGSSDKPINRRPERLLLGHPRVQGVPISVVVLVARRSAPELLAEEQIANTSLRYACLKMFPVELPRKARVRQRTHVNEKLDVLADDELGEFIKLLVRMTHGPNHERHGHPVGND